MGELDLVVDHAGTLVVVEVKTRRSALYGVPAAAVGPAKLARLRRLAGLFLQANGPFGGPVRIDVIAITAGHRLEHLRGVG
jgi:putative endonuclease